MSKKVSDLTKAREEKRDKTGWTIEEIKKKPLKTLKSIEKSRKTTKNQKAFILET